MARDIKQNNHGTRTYPRAQARRERKKKEFQKRKAEESKTPM
jgi:hypothetical protein